MALREQIAETLVCKRGVRDRTFCSILANKPDYTCEICMTGEINKILALVRQEIEKVELPKRKLAATIWKSADNMVFNEGLEEARKSILEVLK